MGCKTSNIFTGLLTACIPVFLSFCIPLFLRFEFQVSCFGFLPAAGCWPLDAGICIICGYILSGIRVYPG